MITVDEGSEITGAMNDDGGRREGDNRCNE